MSITKAIRKAYENARSRGWDKIFVAVDIHDTITASNYKATMPEIIPEAKEAIQFLNTLPEMNLILFSSCYEKDYSTHMQHFEDNDMHFKYFNENPEVPNTETGDFSKKFFYSAIVDDKAGFDTEDWHELISAVKAYRHLLYDGGPSVSFKIHREPSTGRHYVLLYEFSGWDSIESLGRIGPYSTNASANRARDQLTKQSLIEHQNYKKAEEAEAEFAAALRIKYPDDIERECRYAPEHEEWIAWMEANHAWFNNQSFDVVEYGPVRELKMYL